MTGAMDVSRLRQDFPVLRKREIVYLDNACQTLRPQCVIDAVTEYYREYPACGGRSVHRLATKVSIELDQARETMASFLGAPGEDCIIFTKNCTESINMVAQGLDWKRGDVVMTTDLEHNSNHAPWLELQESRGLERVIVPTAPDGSFDLDAYQDSFRKGVKLVSMGHASNITGGSIPARAVVEIAHDKGAKVLLDGAQAAPHQPVDVSAIGADFYAISGHKMMGPSGVGILCGEEEALEELKPLMLGGGTIARADYESITLAPVPERLEPGLANYSGIIGTAAAAKYLMAIGMDAVENHEKELQLLIQERLEELPGLSIIGSEDPAERGGVFSFNLLNLSSHDVAMMLDEMDGVLIRSGMHCVHPYFLARGLKGCARASSYIYNDAEDINRLMDALQVVCDTFSK